MYNAICSNDIQDDLVIDILLKMEKLYALKP